MNKIIISAFILISFFVFPLLSHASYIIHLKDGGRFITEKYWEEDGQIIFFVSGGTMGIDKDNIKKIEKSKIKVEDDYKTKKTDLPPVIIENKPTPEKAVAGEKVAGGEKQDLQKKQLQEELKEMEDQSEKAWKEYLKVIEKEPVTQAERDEARKRYLEINIKKQELIKKLKELDQK